MMTETGSRNTCTACFGNGSCAQCNGSGLDAQRNDEGQSKCRTCSGTGVCTACNGTCAWMVPPPEIIDLGIVNKYSRTNKSL